MCKSIFVRIVVYFMVLKEKRNHGLLVCNLSPIFEKVERPPWAQQGNLKAPPD